MVIVGPTLFDNVTKEMKIYKEIFGPVLSVVRAKNYEEAIELVNNHDMVMAQVFIHQMERLPQFYNFIKNWNGGCKRSYTCSHGIS